MPLPTASDVHVSTPLTNVAIANFQDTNSVYDKVFPVVTVPKQFDKYYVWDAADLNRIEARKKAEGAGAPVAGMRLSSSAFSCDIYHLAAEIPDEVRDNADAALNIETAKTMYLQQNLTMKLEKEWADAFFGTSKGWTDLVAGTDYSGQWDDTGSDPIRDIHEQSTAMVKASGRRPNTLVLGAEVFDALVNHPSIIDRVKHTGRDVPSETILGQIFFPKGGGRVIVGDMKEVSSKEESSSDTNAFLLGKHALLCYAAPAPSTTTPSAGYTFAWQRPGASEMGMRVYRYRDERLHSDVVEVEQCVDFVQTSAILGRLFASAVS